MPNEDHPTRPSTVRRIAIAVFSAIVILVVLLGAVLLSREDGVGGAATTVRQSSADASPTSTILEVRTEVIERLKEILQIRDKAFRERDAEILEDVYTLDCPCLEGDRNAINELTTNNYHMVGGATSVRIRKASQVSARLWLVVADFRSRPLRIEAEDNKLIREEAGGSDLFQCALPKPLVQASGFLAVQQFIRIIQDEPRSNAAITIITLLAALFAFPSGVASEALVKECAGDFIRSSITGEGNRVRLGLVGRNSGCGSSLSRKINDQPEPYFTNEISCSTDKQAAGEGLCSTTPCSASGRFFAFRTIHRPDGSSGPAGFSCVSLEQAVATPGVTVAQVFEAVRRVKLPGGEIGVEPGVRGLANLESFFWVEGVEQAPVDLQVGGSTVHAEFRVVEYRWSFGGGEPLVTTGPGSPGLESEVRTTFSRRGFYRVGVTVMWVAEAYLDGRRVGEVDDLVSSAETTYPVAELRTVLTG